MGIGAVDDRIQLRLGGVKNRGTIDKLKAGHGGHGLFGGGQGAEV